MICEITLINTSFNIRKMSKNTKTALVDFVEESYISFETAKVFKFVFFNTECDENKLHLYYIHAYTQEGKEVWGCYHPDYYPCVTQSLLMNWLRVFHDIHIAAVPFDIEPRKDKGVVRYMPEIYTLPKSGHNLDMVELNVCDSHKEACESAIMYALKYIIKHK